ncbi:hypothetical protein DR62_06740 [Burkholderia thailandensis]|nr:hypothetical protein DR62_06740 [Burkholderia thailandensis]AOI51832.1 hypothetical protein WI24_08460 [Burkholderia thailandensis]MDD1482124.1 hypothetical protein [Burkholderia thailandensis]MDD1488551.1 hypothetical protein [Burkholderia thailandensis]MDD1492366.1 hypothetical protein [Burkholderia thailandensis]
MPDGSPIRATIESHIAIRHPVMIACAPMRESTNRHGERRPPTQRGSRKTRGDHAARGHPTRHATCVPRRRHPPRERRRVIPFTA